MGRFWVRTFLIILAVLIVNPLWAAQGRFIGKEAPHFRVESGDGKILDARMLRGKVIVLFYECKEILDKSRPLKNVLNGFYNEQPKDVQSSILRVPVINAKTASWPFKGAWQNALIEKSQKVGMTVYGDWDGKMGATYAMKDDDTNLVIMDRKGVIRFFQSGVISPEKAPIIISLLLQIVGEKNGNGIQKPKLL
ncbi:MAG: hypothetical protein PHN75_06680 [Syntrophales bacterium]|nr:hypothetical protein [Syntrophales bacterium]